VFNLDQWQEIFHAIASNKLRTFATAFGVFWGILMLILLLGMGQGLHNGLKGTMLLDAANSIWISPWRTSMAYQGMPAGRRLGFVEQDLASVSQHISGIDLMSPENQLQGDYEVSYGGRGTSFQVLGAESDYFAIKVSQETLQGRTLNHLDDVQRRKVCIVGEKAAEVIFPEDVDPVGEYIEIRNVPFQVVGVFSFEAAGGMDQARRIYIPFSTFQAVFNPERSVTLFAVTTAEGVSGKALEQNILKLLKQRQSVHPDDNQAFFTHNQEDQHQRVANLFTAIRLFIWLVGLGTLIAGIVGISNIMIIVVKERTQEIGIRKALGARPASIVAMIMQEAIFVTTVAGYLGLVLGILALEGINALIGSGSGLQFFSRPEIDLGVAVNALVVLVMAGALAGLMPALRAARVQPVEALRKE
jgi:putative ABC transport system permease protein